MAKGVTYFCRDRHGNEYTRYSAGHTTQRYRFASIVRSDWHKTLGTTGPVGKSAVNYSSKRITGLNPAADVEVVEVQAYAGRWKSWREADDNRQAVEQTMSPVLVNAAKTFRQNIQEALASDEAVDVSTPPTGMDAATWANLTTAERRDYLATLDPSMPPNVGGGQ